VSVVASAFSASSMPTRYVCSAATKLKLLQSSRATLEFVADVDAGTLAFVQGGIRKTGAAGAVGAAVSSAALAHSGIALVVDTPSVTGEYDAVFTVRGAAAGAAAGAASALEREYTVGACAEVVDTLAACPTSVASVAINGTATGTLCDWESRVVELTMDADAPPETVYAVRVTEISGVSTDVVVTRVAADAKKIRFAYTYGASASGASGTSGASARAARGDVRVDVLTTKGSVTHTIPRASVVVRPAPWRASLRVKRNGEWVPWTECAPSVGDECAYELVPSGGVAQSAWTQAWTVAGPAAAGGAAAVTAAPTAQRVVVGASKLDVYFTLAAAGKHVLTVTNAATATSCVVGESATSSGAPSASSTDPADAVTRGTVSAVPSVTGLALINTSFRQTQRVLVEMTRDAPAAQGPSGPQGPNSPPGPHGTTRVVMVTRKMDGSADETEVVPTSVEATRIVCAATVLADACFVKFRVTVCPASRASSASAETSEVEVLAYAPSARARYSAIYAQYVCVAGVECTLPIVLDASYGAASWFEAGRLPRVTAPARVALGAVTRHGANELRVAQTRASSGFVIELDFGSGMRTEVTVDDADVARVPRTVTSDVPTLINGARATATLTAAFVRDALVTLVATSGAGGSSSVAAPALAFGAAARPTANKFRCVVGAAGSTTTGEATCDAKMGVVEGGVTHWEHVVRGVVVASVQPVAALAYTLGGDAGLVRVASGANDVRIRANSDVAATFVSATFVPATPTGGARTVTSTEAALFAGGLVAKATLAAGTYAVALVVNVGGTDVTRSVAGTLVAT
jgi:hypothetical protein